jgi:hypothetical protein
MENNILSLKEAIFSHNLIFLQWQKKKVPFDKAIFLTTERSGLDQALFAYPLPWVWATIVLATGYIIQQIPHLTHFNTEDGSSRLLCNFGICLQDYMV